MEGHGQAKDGVGWTICSCYLGTHADLTNHYTRITNLKERIAPILLLMDHTSGPVTFESFKQQWLAEVLDNNPSSVEKGRRFARKVFKQWFDIEDGANDIVYCDGSGDGGIDIAYLERGDSDDMTGDVEGDTWYLVQSKYGTAFAGDNTILTEGKKLLDALEGKRENLSSLASDVLAKIKTFRGSSSAKDRIVLVFAITESLTEAEKQTLKDVRAMGRARLGPIFDVEAITVLSVYERAVSASVDQRKSFYLKADFAPSGELLVGAVSLLDLYAFLKEFRDETQDLNILYEQNVRKFLGRKGKVNKGIQTTLEQRPEAFGAFNNGITIVVNDFQAIDVGGFLLTEPNVVNGCQTTRSIWEVLQQKLDSGGTGENPELEAWKDRAQRCSVVTKIVRLGASVPIEDITRYTNSQNAVREKDFLALNKDFRTWATQMAQKYGVFLEIQRGAWEAQQAAQSQREDIQHFAKMANAFDLLKVYGSGWLGEAGIALGKDGPFQPSGHIFKKIVNNDDSSFAVEDLYAAHLLKQRGDELGFGRNALLTRRQTRFLFYYVFIELVRHALVRAGKTLELSNITDSVIKVFTSTDPGPGQQLIETSITVIDNYMTAEAESSVFEEPEWNGRFNKDLGNFLKWEQLCKDKNNAPIFQQQIAVAKMMMSKKVGTTSLTDELKKIICG